jgi:hypothetical protein
MKFGESSPEQDPLGRVADKRAEEFFGKVRAEKLVAIEEALAALRAKLGVKAGESLRDFLGLSPSKKPVDEKASSELDPTVGAAIDDLFQGLYSVYEDGAEWDKTFRKKDSNRG